MNKQTITKQLRTAIVVLGAVALSACSGETSEQKAAKELVLDGDTNLVASCSTDAIRSVAISTLSWQETSAICEKMERRIGHPPSVKLLRSLSKAVSSMHMMDEKIDIVDNAYQYMRVVESRKQLGDDDKMINTFNVVFKIWSGMEKRVTPKDLNILLSNMDGAAAKLSDDGIYGIAALLSVQRQNQGL